MTSQLEVSCKEANQMEYSLARVSGSQLSPPVPDLTGSA